MLTVYGAALSLDCSGRRLLPWFVYGGNRWSVVDTLLSPGELHQSPLMLSGCITQDTSGFLSCVACSDWRIDTQIGHREQSGCPPWALLHCQVILKPGCKWVPLSFAWLCSAIFFTALWLDLRWFRWICHLIIVDISLQIRNIQI